MQIQKIAAASFMPSLQNNGQISGTVHISGELDASPNYASGNTSNLTNPNGTPIIIPLSNTSVICSLRVNFPDMAGDLAAKWFPLVGTFVGYDNVNYWKIILYSTSHPQGRAIYFNVVNTRNARHDLSNFRINIYGHLYSYPW